MASRERSEESDSTQDIYLKALDRAQDIIAMWTQYQTTMKDEIAALEELYAYAPSDELANMLAEARAIYHEFLETHGRALMELMAKVYEMADHIKGLYHEGLQAWVDTMRPPDVHK